MILSQIYTSNNKRTKTIKLNVIYSTLIKLVSLCVSFFLVPMTIDYVSPELYGIWLSLSSIVSWFGLFDVGFGLGMRNKLTTALAQNKIRYGKIVVSTTYAAIAVIFSIVGIVASTGCTFIDWSYLLNISPQYNHAVTVSFQIVIVSFCLRAVLQLVSNVCQAYQMTALGSAIDASGSLVAFVFIYILTKTLAPSLVYLAVVFCLSPLLTFFLANIILYKKKFSDVSPSIKYVRKFVLYDVSNLGAKFFLIQIICVVLYQATNIIISHFCGPEQVTVYNIAYKYLNMALIVITFIQSPLWSAFNDAFAKKDYVWMRSIYKKLISILVLAEIFLIIFVLISPFFYKIWIGNRVFIPTQITVLLAIYTGILLNNNLHAIIINGIGTLKIQIIIAWLQGIVYIPLVYILANYYQLEGILMALLIITLLPSYFLVKQVRCLLTQTADGIYKK